MKIFSITLLVIIFFIIWIFACLKKHPIRFFPLLLVGISSFLPLSYYNIPSSIFFSIMFIGSYLMMLVLHLKTNNYNYLKVKRHRWDYPAIIIITYFLYLFFYLLSTLFGEYTSHYLTSVLYYQFIIIASIFIFDYLRRYNEALLFILYGFFIFGIITSILLVILFFTTMNTNFVRSISVENRVLRNILGSAGHYNILIIAFISGLILLLFKLENIEKIKTFKRKFNKKILFIYSGVFLIFFAIILTGGRYNLTISSFLLVSYFLFFLKKRTVKLNIRVFSIIFPVFFSGLFIFNRQYHIIEKYLERFGNFLYPDYMTVILGERRLFSNRLLISKSSNINFFGKGKGVATNIIFQYFDFGLHNAYLGALFDGGVIVFFLYILIILLIFILAFKKKGYFGVGIFSIGFFLLTYSFYGFFFSDIVITFLISISIGIYNLSSKKVND